MEDNVNISRWSTLVVMILLLVGSSSCGPYAEEKDCNMIFERHVAQEAKSMEDFMNSMDMKTDLSPDRRAAASHNLGLMLEQSYRRCQKDFLSMCVGKIPQRKISCVMRSERGIPRECDISELYEVQSRPCYKGKGTTVKDIFH